MDDSNISHQWTMNSFNQVIPSHQIVAASGESSQPSLSQESFSSCPNSFYTTRNDVSSSNSILTHSPNSLFGWSNTFGRPSTQPKEEVEFVISYNNSEQNYEAIGSKQRSNMVKFGAASPQAQDHIVAERKRREKLNQRFIELSAAIPGLKKMDKASILEDAVKYVKELSEKVKTLEDQSPKTIESVVLRKKSCRSCDQDGSSSYNNHDSKRCLSEKPLPEIDARIHEKNILVRIHCENLKGVLVKVLSEIEELHLSVTNTSLMPFQGGSIIITVIAQIEEDFNLTVEDLARKLNSALQQFMPTS
ncbi:transcription factor bHLH18-like isoform X2 [Ananas comosus]|nr:transcription factor bHLH18-like isoform X2 [Ananas comosus]